MQSVFAAARPPGYFLPRNARESPSPATASSSPSFVIRRFPGLSVHSAAESAKYVSCESYFRKGRWRWSNSVGVLMFPFPPGSSLELGRRYTGCACLCLTGDCLLRVRRRSGGVARRLVDGHPEDEPDCARFVRIGIAAVVLPRQPCVERAADVLLDRRDAPAQLGVVVRVLGVDHGDAGPRVTLEVLVL